MQKLFLWFLREILLLELNSKKFSIDMSITQKWIFHGRVKWTKSSVNQKTVHKIPNDRIVLGRRDDENYTDLSRCFEAMPLLGWLDWFSLLGWVDSSCDFSRLSNLPSNGVTYWRNTKKTICIHKQRLYIFPRL